MSDNLPQKNKKRSFFYHIHPPLIPAATLKFSHTWGLGGSALILVLMQMLTGLLLLFSYSPDMGNAYQSVLFLRQDILFGNLIQNLHYFGANFLIIIVFCHMLRVFFTGAYHNQRKVNWWIGLGLFLCVATANFTGYLLPLDQLAYWAITICAGMFEYIPYIGPPIRNMILGGPDITQSTLSNFYAIHIALVPAVLLFLLPLHFWKVRKAGGVVTPASMNGGTGEKPKKIAAVPHLVTREITVALVLVAGLLVISILFDAPLYGPANEGMSPNPTKAPWYFSGLQELLQLFAPFFAVVVIPILSVLWLVCLPYMKTADRSDGTWFLSANGRKTGLIALLTSLIGVPAMVVAGEQVSVSLPWIPEAFFGVLDGAVPFAVVMAFIWGFYHTMKIKFAASRDEAVQAVCILLLSAFLVLMVVSIWFRGPGMALCWPWEITMNEIATVQ